MRKRPQLVPWRAAGQLSERQASSDDVVRLTGWVFNNERGDDVTLEEFVATGDAEVGSYLTVFRLRDDGTGLRPLDQQSLVEIGCGIGRMTCAFTREFGRVVACDLDAGFLQRCVETVNRFGKVDRLSTSHVEDGATLSLPPNSADVVFSYITFQHCDPDDALELTSEAVRVAKPGGKVVLNYRARGRGDVILLPMSKVVRGLFRVPKLGERLSRHRTFARIGWQANRLHPNEVISPLAPLFKSVELWRHPKSTLSARGASIETFEGINPHHYWIVATVR